MQYCCNHSSLDCQCVRWWKDLVESEGNFVTGRQGACGRNIHHPAQWPYGAAHWQVKNNIIQDIVMGKGMLLKVR